MQYCEVFNDFKQVIPTLTMLMRGGGVPEADRVQRYCAYAICNILSSFVDKAIIDELIKNNTLSDIVVITLLRVNSGLTKEALSKVIFNFLTRSEFREVIIFSLNVPYSSLFIIF
jgi:hypothetical protein